MFHLIVNLYSFFVGDWKGCVINDKVVTDILLMKHSQYGKSKSTFEMAAEIPKYKEWMDTMDEDRDPTTYYSKLSFSKFDLEVRAAKSKRDKREEDLRRGEGSSKKLKKRQETAEVVTYKEKKSKKKKKGTESDDEDN